MRRLFGLFFSLALSFLFIFLYRPAIFEIQANDVFNNLESSWQDFLFRVNRNHLKHGDPRIIIAAIDDPTLHQYGYPLPRIVYAKLLDRLHELKVKTVAFDVLFADPRKGDSDLARALGKFNKSVLAYVYDQNSSEHFVLPTRPLYQAAKRLGYVNVGNCIDPDGHIREFQIFQSSFKNPKTNSMGEALSVPTLAYFTGQLFEKTTGLGPTDAHFYINFRPPTYANDQNVLFSYPVFSIAKILSKNLPQKEKDALKGALVLVGSTALSAFDHYPSPFSDASPGVEYHANILDNLLHRNWMRPFSPFYQIFIILLFIWLPFFLRRAPTQWETFSVFGVFLAWLCFCEWQFLKGVRVEFVLPSAALLTSFFGETIHQALTEGREKKFIKHLFAQFVSPEVVEDLAKNPDKIKLGGEKKDMTVLFLDIAHFTSISEKMSPEELIKFLNRYLSRLSQVIHDHGGVVDKYIGDSIMAFWNAPLEVKSHRMKACLAALSLQDAVLELNKNLPSSIPHPPQVRIGINSGIVTVGLTGSEHKLQYTVIGDEVNLASRLEGANKFFKSQTMISEAVYAEAKAEIEAREIGIIRVLGKETPIKTYQILDRKGALSRSWKTALPIYNQALQDVRNKEYVNAIHLFETFLKIIPNDGTASFYLSACKKAQESTPWDGIIHLTSK